MPERQIKTGMRLWEKAKKIIPGGNQLLSKRAEKLLPGLWPAYFEKAKGCEVWDLDGNHFYDFAMMGIGACALGYADDDVDNAVIEAVKKGTMGTLNCHEEVALAEKLIDIHPWADMARFTKSGGEACAVAIRIARAATGKDKVAFCGYHGWSDWYIAANIGDETNLNDQLLPGLKSRGVPKGLKDTALPFRYNHLEELESLVEKYPNDIGVIIMEPRRESEPKKGFLDGVREIADKIGAVLIIDEITAGFRMNFGGLHLKYGITPDMAVFGKALGNGYPISAIIGKQQVMDAAQESFISSTLWTERIGFVAALATLEKMETANVQQHLIKCGEMINSVWKNAAAKHNLDIHISSIPPLTHFSFEAENPLEPQTLFAQEMLEQGFLAAPSVYATYAYNEEIINKYADAVDKAFATIKEAFNSGNIKKYLKGDVIQAGFKRLT